MDFTKHTVPLYICAQSGNQNTYLHWYVSVGTFPQTSETVIVFVSHIFDSSKIRNEGGTVIRHYLTIAL